MGYIDKDQTVTGIDRMSDGIPVYIENQEHINEKRKNSMKLKITEGCVCYRFTVDGKDIDSLSEKELKDILKAAVTKITTTNYEDKNIIYCLQNTLYEIVSRFYDEYENDDKPCECCGDFVETFKMEI